MIFYEINGSLERKNEMKISSPQQTNGSLSVFTEYLSLISDLTQRNKLTDLLFWITQEFPKLSPSIAWNQSMFTDHGTYIIGFSVAKKHFSVAPEKATMLKFAREIEQAGYDQTALLFRIRWEQSIDLSLLEKIIRFNIIDKEKCSSFWR